MGWGRKSELLFGNRKVGFMRTAKVRTNKSLHPFETHRIERVHFSRFVCFLCLLSSCGCIIAILAGFLLATIPVLMIGFALEDVAARSDTSPNRDAQSCGRPLEHQTEWQSNTISSGKASVSDAWYVLHNSDLSQKDARGRASSGPFRLSRSCTKIR